MQLSCSCTVYVLNAVVPFLCWSGFHVSFTCCMLLYRLRVEVGSTRLRVGGGVGISLCRVLVGSVYALASMCLYCLRVECCCTVCVLVLVFMYCLRVA